MKPSLNENIIAKTVLHVKCAAMRDAKNV